MPFQIVFVQQLLRKSLCVSNVLRHGAVRLQLYALRGPKLLARQIKVADKVRQVISRVPMLRMSLSKIRLHAGKIEHARR